MSMLQALSKRRYDTASGEDRQEAIKAKNGLEGFIVENSGSKANRQLIVSGS